ncbi:hypothetical protein FNF27_02291 [Cafeteria roenbergensis]|nr:hypothetical protein FNF28_04217 [Cafeteria roenbergensis]KAA0168069.1 hypothetical protein FNF31_00568 [Cafeteria roenbergensis]KAA0176234.1 hypothetical protein FNF27_02291 [Cafeteria roenbergensis]
MLGFIDFDAAKAGAEIKVSIAKAKCQCDERGEPWDQTSFPTLPDTIFWARQALALVVGLVCGAIPATGWFGIGAWVLLVGLPTIAYTQTYMDIDWAAVDAERDDGVSFSWAKLAQEGAPAAFGTFCLVWVLTFNALHPGTDYGAMAAAA